MSSSWLCSCPLTPIVSKASSGAMEFMSVYSVRDMAKFLAVSLPMRIGSCFVAFPMSWHVPIPFHNPPRPPSLSCSDHLPPPAPLSSYFPFHVTSLPSLFLSSFYLCPDLITCLLLPPYSHFPFLLYPFSLLAFPLTPSPCRPTHPSSLPSHSPLLLALPLTPPPCPPTHPSSLPSYSPLLLALPINQSLNLSPLLLALPLTPHPCPPTHSLRLILLITLLPYLPTLPSLSTMSGQAAKESDWSILGTCKPAAAEDVYSSARVVNCTEYQVTTPTLLVLGELQLRMEYHPALVSYPDPSAWRPAEGSGYETNPAWPVGCMSHSDHIAQFTPAEVYTHIFFFPLFSPSFHPSSVVSTFLY